MSDLYQSPAPDYQTGGDAKEKVIEEVAVGELGSRPAKSSRKFIRNEVIDYLALEYWNFKITDNEDPCFVPVIGDGPHIAYYSHTTTNEWYFDRVKNLLDPGYPVTYTNKTNLYPPFSNRQPCNTEWVAQRLAELRKECADFAANLLK